MTISSINRKAGPYAGNGVATAFPFSFKVFSAADVYAVRADSTGNETDLALITDYTVALNADQNANPGGTLTLLSPLADGYKLAITSNLDYLQPTDLTNNGGFYPKVITNALDRLTIFTQQLYEGVKRSMVMPISSDLSSFQMAEGATATGRANKVIGFDDAGNPVLKDAADNNQLRVDLNASSGAGIIGWIQSGVGAVARLIRDKLRESVSVKDFGAVGDGVTDDTAAIQAAIDASAGKRLLFPSGIYIVSTLNIGVSILFSGVGSGSILKQKAGTNNFMLQLTLASASLKVSDLILNQNNTGQTTGSGLFLFNTTQAGVFVEFDGVTFRDFCEGAIRIVGDRTASTREVLKVRNCRFKGGTESESGIYNTFTIFAADASELTVEGCDFDHGLTISKQGIPAISVAGVTTPSAEYTEVTIRNNRFRNYGRFTSGSGIGVIDCYVWADKVDISGNKFVGSYTAPIRGKTNAQNLTIIGNIMTDFNNPGTPSMAGGIALVSATLSPTNGRYVIAENIITGSLYRGIEVSDSGGNPESLIIAKNIITSPADIGIYVLGCTGFAIDGNVIKGAGQQGIAFSSCTGIGRIDNNTINTTAGVGIGYIGNQTTLDIQVHNNFILAATASGVTIENVRYLSLQNNTVKDVVNSGSQRGFRVGGSVGINDGQVKNNTALGTYATAAYSIITNGFLNSCYEFGNSWNYQARYLPAAPTTGTWARGDIVWHSSPAASGNIGWVCTAAGTPGTWKAFGTIAA